MTKTMTTAVAVNGLTKRYGHRVAVDELGFEVPTGSLAGFIGPNGAGKTTTLRMLVGLVAPTSGTGEMLDQPLTDPSRYLACVGALIEGPAFYPGLSGRHNLRVLAAAAGIETADIDALLARVGLRGRGDDPYKTYSLGMKQRLGIAAALLGDPELLLLDEPANGLDPEGMHDIRELLRALRKEGRTVLVSSHLLAELEQVCDWLVVISDGRRIFQGRPEQLLGGEQLVLRPERGDEVAVLARLLAERRLAPQVEDGQVRVAFADADGRRGEIAEIVRGVQSAGITLVEIAAHRPQLEQRYLELIGGER
jgi:ABC-2 type transport system ATP-binding protein